MRGRTRQIGTALAVWARRRWWVVVGLAVFAIVLGIGLIFSLVLARQTSELLSQPDQAHADLTRNAYQYQADNLTKLWTGVIGIFTGVAAIVAGVIAWRNLRATQAKLEVDREAQITNRFTQAIGQLGAELKNGEPNLEVRLGGIYALERIARDSPWDHESIMEVLTAYVRQNARWTSPSPSDAADSSSPEWPREESPKSQELAKLRIDIQAVLTVLGRRMPPREWLEQDLDLTGTDLCRANLFRAHLSRANLYEANLNEANLNGADLNGANLYGTNLNGANLYGANLSRAFLNGANFSGADLVTADFSGADLSEADLSGAFLFTTDLTGADLTGAILTEADLSGADLSEADLSEAKELTVDQVKSARSYVGARLPPQIAEELDRLATESAPSPPPASPAS